MGVSDDVRLAVTMFRLCCIWLTASLKVIHISNHDFVAFTGFNSLHVLNNCLYVLNNRITAKIKHISSFINCLAC